MAVNLTGIVSDLSSVIPSSSDVLQQVLIGAGASVVLGGLKSQQGLDAVDPLHILPGHSGNNNQSSVIVGKTIPATALATLSADQIKALAVQGYSFV